MPYFQEQLLISRGEKRKQEKMCVLGSGDVFARGSPREPRRQEAPTSLLPPADAASPPSSSSQMPQSCRGTAAPATPAGLLCLPGREGGVQLLGHPAVLHAAGAEEGV